MNNSMTALYSAAIALGLLWLKIGIAFSQMARRKGINAKLAFLGAFPPVALFFGLWLMTRPNTRVPLEEERLEDDSGEWRIDKTASS